MDIGSHAAWGSTLFRSPKVVWWAALSGALPDIIPALVGFIRFRGKYRQVLQGIEQQEHFNDVYMRVYYTTHSLIPISCITVLLFIFLPNYWFLVVPYYFHIALDMVTHEKVWSTRLLYPFSDFHFIFGKNWWREKWIIATNWLALLIINAFIILR